MYPPSRVSFINRPLRPVFSRTLGIVCIGLLLALEEEVEGFLDRETLSSHSLHDAAVVHLGLLAGFSEGHGGRDLNEVFWWLAEQAAATFSPATKHRANADALGFAAGAQKQRGSGVVWAWAYVLGGD